MKVTISNGVVMVEDGPPLNPDLSAEDGQAESMLKAIQWASLELLETANRLCAESLTRRVIERHSGAH